MKRGGHLSQPLKNKMQVATIQDWQMLGQCLVDANIEISVHDMCSHLSI